MATPVPQIAMVANLWSRQMLFELKGDAETTHTHEFDHLTLLAKGSLQVTVNEQTTVYQAPTMIYIRAHEYHTLVALEDQTVAYCIHALRDRETGDILDPAMIPNGITHSDMGIAAIVKPTIRRD
jgi:mannose-6-phosphate isomerase-like protein (cupin superfamily)